MDIFDFIVVGAGSAGCAAAARLSENSQFSVLLLEAGDEGDTWKVQMPLAVDQLMNGDRYNWRYETQPESGIKGRVMEHPRGKVMGGSSAINGMVYTRGHPQDYDEWRDLYGADGWGYEDVLPYFKRMETAPQGSDSAYRGTSGPMKISIPDYKKNPLNIAFLKAAEECGHPLTKDNNGAQHEGFGHMEQTIFGGERFTTAKAYLTKAVRARPNLTILPKAQAQKLTLEGDRVTGVEVKTVDETHHFKARREVILSAGAVGSPQLLLLSGIGPKGDLQRLGIECHKDLAGVGENLQDHPDITVQYACKKPVSLLKYTRWPRKAFVGLDWFLRRKGPASSNQFEMGAYLRTRDGLQKPNVKLEFFPLAISHKTLAPYDIDAFQIHLTLQASPMRGQLKLASSDPAQRPIITMGYLQNEQDFRDFAEAVDLVRRLIEAPAFNPFRGKELSPGPERARGDAFNDWVREHLNTAYHLSCSCKMGPKDDPMAVVAPDLSVHGLQGLRIADASIMPHVVTANTNATTIMIGERVADFCLGKRLPPAPEAKDWLAPKRLVPPPSIKLK